MRLRGLVWIGVGLAIYFGGLALGRPLVVRFTPVPLGLVIAAIGILFVAYDLTVGKRRKTEIEGKQ